MKASAPLALLLLLAGCSSPGDGGGPGGTAPAYAFAPALTPDGRVALAYADDAGSTRVNSVVLQSAGPRLLA